MIGFSEVQKADLGISGVTYDTALAATARSEIDQADRMGRTTFCWASQRGDEATVAQPLACGADPNRTDLSGMKPVHWASTDSSEQCMRLLLASKADLEAKDR